ncbi:hypothetical protein GCM10011608_10050 [Micromonospora sonchi]|uniref:Uncharacterized protein n=1 Tax=Micromonospora sonchi TaxID=1763543 RepID=A0A917TL46_9ACTN|nr:hypothetical protein [Micromonospora sonchi]GGM27291.1 hypothetical protein GCM10011608_10050 [Micromonospora sonchi]
MTQNKIFGREPALIVGAVGSILTVLAALNTPGIDAGAAAAITAFIASAIIALTTRPWAPALFTGVIAAAAALVAEYGMSVPDGVTGAVSGAALAWFALAGIRPQVEPAGDVPAESEA